MDAYSLENWGRWVKDLLWQPTLPTHPMPQTLMQDLQLTVLYIDNHMP